VTTCHHAERDEQIENSTVAHSAVLSAGPRTSRRLVAFCSAEMAFFRGANDDIVVGRVLVRDRFLAFRAALPTDRTR